MLSRFETWKDSPLHTYSTYLLAEAEPGTRPVLWGPLALRALGTNKSGAWKKRLVRLPADMRRALKLDPTSTLASE